MINKLLGAAAMAAVACAVVPAIRRSMGGCSGENLTKTESMVEAMADGEGKIVAQKEIAMAQTRHARRQDGRLRHASEQGDARGHGEVSLDARGRLRSGDRPFRLVRRLNLQGACASWRREIGDRLGVDLALVPLLDHGEIGAAGLPVLAALPAIAGEIIRGRGQHVGRAVQQVAAAVAVEIDRDI